MMLSKAKFTSVGVCAYLHDKKLELRIHEDDESFKVIHRPEHKPTWQKLVELYDETSVSSEKIALSATDIFAAEVELRKLLSAKDGVTLSSLALFRFTKEKVRFALHANQLEPAALGITSQPERMNSGNPRAEAYLTTLRSSLMCRSAEMLSNSVSVVLAPKFSSNKKRFATYEELVNLY